MKYLKYIVIVGAFLFFSNSVKAQISGIMNDDGTSTQGDMIFPKKMAMFCGISSYDAYESEKIGECLDSILRLKLGSQLEKPENYHQIFNELYHQMNSSYYDVAVNRKTLAGDFEDEMTEKIDEKVNTQGAKTDSSDTVTKKQEQSARLLKLTADATINLIDVTASLASLNAIKYFYDYEFSDDAAEIEEE